MQRSPIDRSTETDHFDFVSISDECIHIKYASIQCRWPIVRPFGGLFLICNVCDAILGAVIFQSVLNQTLHSPFLWHSPMLVGIVVSSLFFLPTNVLGICVPTDIRSMQSKTLLYVFNA